MMDPVRPRRIQHDNGPAYVYQGRLVWGPGGDVNVWECQWCKALVRDHHGHTGWHEERE